MKRILILVRNFFFPKKKIIDLKNVKFGWKPDKPDPRDFKYKITEPKPLPSKVDLRKQCPSIYDQGELGSCTANALGAAFQFEQMKQNKKDFMPSRLFIYYNERAMENTTNEDAGATIRDGIKTMVKDGVCPESLWRYQSFKLTKKPTPDCYTVALDNQVQQYMAITPNSIYEIKNCLSEGYPVVFGITLYESFMSNQVARNGYVSMPTSNDQIVGSHAICAVGYDSDKGVLIVRNSWSKCWGDRGYFYLPFEYVVNPNLAADFWTIRLVE